MNTLHLSWLMLRRDWRTGEWRVLLIALVLAVGSIATVGLFANRVGLALQQEATSLLGADLRLVATHPFPPAYRAAALQRGLRVVEIATFPSMVVYDQQNVLAEIQAVEEGYPLRGKIHIDDGTQHVAQGIPAPGTIWADKRLLQRMGLQLGNEVVIGALHMRVAARMVRDVDQSVGFASFAPRVQINAADLPASGLVQPGSRISYKILFAGDSAQLVNLRVWLKGQLVVGEKLEDVRDARPEIRTALERAEHFLGLAALTAVVLAGVAMALAASHFIMRHLDTCAMMRCLGATQAQVLRIFMYQFLLLGIFAVLLGDLLGYAAQFALVQSIESMSEAALPSPGWLPLWQAAASGMALLLGFAFLPLWQLKRVSPLRVIRRELGMPPARTGLLYVSGAAVLSGLFLWQAGSLKLGLTVLGGVTAGMLLFGLLAWLAVHTLAWLPLRGSHAFANLARHGRTNALQIVALSLGGMALLLLTFVRADLLESWRGRMPPDAPNRFIVNIQPDQRSAIKNFFTEQQLPAPQLFPMVRGRLIAINNHAISGNDYSETRARALVEREFNLSWSDHLPTDNALVQGAWWKQGASSVLSVEEGIAKTLGINMGDTLTYDVAGSPFSAQVVNLRKVQWDSMQVNFYVITASNTLIDYPASYLTSFYLPADKAQASDVLIKAFPNLLLIDTDAVIEQVRQIMDQIAQTMSAVFLFTLLSGLAVLYAALLATQDERIQQAAILRTLGADSRYLRRLHLTEFAVLGALSGLFAAAGGTLLGWVLAIKVLEIPYHPSALIWLVGVGGGIVTVTLAGWLATRRVAQISPLQVLQSV
ncbi:ABC transporter permease [Candidatus Nitrotoga arctica]|uniref:Inner membrane transport permease n=1 Tax=Candidatus Nitrotoga arctica TaxID=453162 RepID=A0ABM8YZT9_9PROT|nr:FtsX-like permease family protein [Candidatus Nitrotoga arctica]CAG9933119.1 Inner membrane transport permease [Candidatus Nitrotoga arctica]